MLEGSIAEELEAEGVDSWLVAAVAGLARGASSDVDQLLVSLGGAEVIESTRTNVRCHLIGRDANHFVRVPDLTRLLADQVLDYCIPKSRVAAAAEHYRTTKSTDRLLRLQAEARELFTHLEKSGEGGELLLYLLLERLLGLPQLLCKMPLKTNTEMHVHGTDGIHGRVLPNGNLALYWGESKLHARINQAIDECFESIAPFLADETGEVRRRDVLLLRDNLDTGDVMLTDALRRFFTEHTPEAARVEFRGACLVGFSMEDYPIVNDPEVLAALIEPWLTRIREQVDFRKLATFEVEVFCVPFPSVQAFRDLLRAELGLT